MRFNKHTRWPFPMTKVSVEGVCFLFLYCFILFVEPCISRCNCVGDVGWTRVWTTVLWHLCQRWQAVVTLFFCSKSIALWRSLYVVVRCETRCSSLRSCWCPGNQVKEVRAGRACTAALFAVNCGSCQRSLRILFSWELQHYGRTHVVAAWYWWHYIGFICRAPSLVDKYEVASMFLWRICVMTLPRELFSRYRGCRKKSPKFEDYKIRHT